MPSESLYKHIEPKGCADPLGVVKQDRALSESGGAAVPTYVTDSLPVSLRHFHCLTDARPSWHWKVPDFIPSSSWGFVPLFHKHDSAASPKEPRVVDNLLQGHGVVDRVGHEEGMLEGPIVSSAGPDGEVGATIPLENHRRQGVKRALTGLYPVGARNAESRGPVV